VPFEKFPYNGYDVLDPEVDLEKWTLTVEGDVQHPGEYTLAQIQALPKLSQNTAISAWRAGTWSARLAARVSPTS